MKRRRLQFEKLDNRQLLTSLVGDGVSDCAACDPLNLADGQLPVIQDEGQLAEFTGPAAEEIHLDDYGRVKVQFPWERDGEFDENSSCWIRVSQVHAGNGFGGIDIPTIGDDVIVDFVEGDPDRPIIIGRVYHAENMPPFGLPGGKNISGIKSNSTPGGGGYNEFVLDDTKGNELIGGHGQFDKDSTIENDLREHVLHDRGRDVTNNETIEIGVDRPQAVDNNETISVGNDRAEEVGNNETLSVGSDRTRTVGKNETVTVTLTRNHSVGVNEMINVGAAQQLTPGDQNSLTTGKASIVMKKDGTITIRGKDITITGKEQITGKATRDLVLKGKNILQN